MAKFSYTTLFWIVSIVLIIAKILFLYRPEIDLFTEEAQYWLWSRNLAWHYYSKPPLVSFLNYISTTVFGINEFAVRFNAIVFGLGTSWVVYRFGTYLHGEKVGFWASLILQAMPSWWLISTFHTTDTSLTFFWSLTIFYLYKGIKENRYRWWIIAGFSAALGLMAKAVMVFAFPFLLIFLFFEKSVGKYWKKMLLFFLIMSLGFIPVLVWNFQNDFDTFKHIANLAGAGKSGDSSFSIGTALGHFFEFFGGQLAMVSIFLLPLILPTIKHVLKYRSQENFYLILPACLTFLGFSFLSFFTEILINWAMFSYVGLPILISSWMINQSRNWVKIRNWGIGLSLFFPLLLILPDVTLLKSIPPIKKGEKQVFRRMSGYDPLASRVDYLKDSLGLSDPFVFSETYHMASELSFYMDDHPQTYMLNMGSRRNQFDLWPGMEQFLNKEMEGIFVSWNFDSPGEFAEFDSLLFQEDFEVFFNDEPLRKARIQIWKNLKELNPFVPETY